MVNTEGTRLRIADGGALLIVTAEIQADDGMRISSALNYYGETPDELPSAAKVMTEIDELAWKLTAASRGPVLESYTGPVLFDAPAAGQVFRRLLAEGVAGNPDPIGTGRRMMPGPENLQKKLGQRILPKSFNVHDDPAVSRVGEAALMGHYRFDAEGGLAQRVQIVRADVLENLLLSRVPTRKMTGTNGHARRPAGGGTWRAAI